MSSGRKGARSNLDRRIGDALATTGLTWGASVADVLAAVADHRGRLVEVSPLPAALNAQRFGALLPYPDRDDVLYRPGTPEQELHNLLHLSAHLLLDHAEAQCSPASLDDLAQLVPDLAPTLVARVLATTPAARSAEDEAEAFVTALAGSLAA